MEEGRRKGGYDGMMVCLRAEPGVGGGVSQGGLQAEGLFRETKSISISEPS